MSGRIILLAVLGVAVFPWSVAKGEWRHQDDESRSGHHHSGESGSGFRRDYNSNDPEAIVRRAYQDILGREPDEAGMRTYRSKIIDNNWTEKEVRNDLRHSAEAKGRTPEAAEKIIRRAYQDVLGREPDAAGLATYRDKLVNEGWSERDVRSALKSSEERRETGGISEEQARQMVKRAYQSVLKRDPDEAGMATYVQKIRQKRWSEKDVASDLRNSAEYKRKNGRK